MQRIGLYGGSFDPIHLGHLLVGQAAMEELALDRLYFIPAARSPFKPDSEPAPGFARLAMIRLALVGYPEYEVDDNELKRGGSSFTIDTVRTYAMRYPAAKLFYLIGADNVPSLPLWREAEQLAEGAEFVIIPRPGQPQNQLPAPFKGRYLGGFPCGVSSSQIRTRVKAGQPINPLVPAAVAEYIHNNRLYL